MLEVALIVLVCCNKDGSKKKAITTIGIIGIVGGILLTIFWNIFAIIDVVLYAVLMIIGLNQGKKKEPLPKPSEEPKDPDLKDFE